MSDKNDDKKVSRRDFHRLTLAALGGLAAASAAKAVASDSFNGRGRNECGGKESCDGKASCEGKAGCEGKEKTEAGCNGPDGCSGKVSMASDDGAEKHVCCGLNECKGQGGGGDNECAGTGKCATAAHHECAGGNECKGQGGCAASMGNNSCKGEGKCAVPLGEKAWKAARANFEKSMTKAGKRFGEADCS